MAVFSVKTVLGNLSIWLKGDIFKKLLLWELFLMITQCLLIH